MKTNGGEGDVTTRTLSSHPAPWEVASGWGNAYAGKAEARGAPTAPTVTSGSPHTGKALLCPGPVVPVLVAIDRGS